MRNRRSVLVKCITATFVFTGVCFMNIQNAKADTILKVNQTVSQDTSQSNSTKTITDLNNKKDKSQDISNKISRSAASKGNQVVDYSYRFLGKPYSFGANGPNAFDCSGLTQYVYNKFGVGLPRTTYTQVNQGIKVDKADLKPGDLVFFNTSGSISHVGIYIGGGDFIHAPRSGKPVMISSLTEGYYYSRYATARRILN